MRSATSMSSARNEQRLTRKDAMGPVFGAGRLSVRTQTFAGFAALLLLCAVLASTSIIGMRVVDGSVDDSHKSSTAAISALELAGRVAQLDAEVSRFALTGTTADENAARQQLSVTAEAFARISQTGDIVAGQQISGAFAHYRDTTEATFETVHDRFEAANKVKQTSSELANATSAVVARLLREKRDDAMSNGVRLDEAMQASLIAATRYFNSLNPADANSAKAYLKILQREIEGLSAVSEGVPALQRIAGALPEMAQHYASSIEALMSATDHYRVATRDQIGAAEALDALAKLYETQNIDAQGLMVMKASRALSDVIFIDVGTAIGVLLIGAALSYIVSRGIAAAREEAERARQLA